MLAEALVTGVRTGSERADEILGELLADEQRAVEQEIARRLAADPTIYPYVVPELLEGVAITEPP
jgi:hypothetical protein